MHLCVLFFCYIELQAVFFIHASATTREASKLGSPRSCIRPHRKQSSHRCNPSCSRVILRLSRLEEQPSKAEAKEIRKTKASRRTASQQVSRARDKVENTRCKSKEAREQQDESMLVWACRGGHFGISLWHLAVFVGTGIRVTPVPPAYIEVSHLFRCFTYTHTDIHAYIHPCMHAYIHTLSTYIKYIH